ETAEGKRSPAAGADGAGDAGEGRLGLGRGGLRRPQQSPERLEGLQLATAGAAVGEGLLDFQRALQRELPVEVGVKGSTRMFVEGSHQFLLRGSPTSSLTSCDRARDRRDITVPIGTPRMSAISR